MQIEDGSLGSPPAEQILRELRPSHWFSAHLHVKYAAVVPHHPQQQTPHGRVAKRKNPCESNSSPAESGEESNASRTFTKFLALDKCLPRRGFLQVGCSGSCKRLSADSNKCLPCLSSALSLTACPRNVLWTQYGVDSSQFPSVSCAKRLLSNDLFLQSSIRTLSHCDSGDVVNMTLCTCLGAQADPLAKWSALLSKKFVVLNGWHLGRPAEHSTTVS